MDERKKLRPELTIAVECDNEHHCGIKLMNKGYGTAIIKNVQFSERNTNGGEQFINSIDDVRKFWNALLSLSGIF